MLDKNLIRRIIDIKIERRWTLFDLSKRLDVGVPTIERWFKTSRINKVYAALVRERLQID